MNPKLILVAVVLVLGLVAALVVGDRVLNAPRSADPSQNRVSERTTDRQCIIESNGIPDHTTGLFPNANDPFPIRPQEHTYTVALEPVVNRQATPIGVWQFGVAVNGVPFDPAGPFLHGDRQSGWQFDPLHPPIGAHLGVDEHNAHTQPGGGYHYHGLPVGLYRRLVVENGGEQSRPILLGRAADGFPIYGPCCHTEPGDAGSEVREMRPSHRLRSGTRPEQVGGRHDGSFLEDHEFVRGSGDLDECNGHFGVTGEYPDGIWHYHVTRTFPGIPRLFRGTPDPSFFPPGGGPGPGELPPGLRSFPELAAPRD
jgi:hypothetical protein